MEGFERVHAGRQVEAVAKGFGEGFVGGDVRFGEFAEDGPDDSAEPAGGELGTPGSFAAERLVDGDDATHFEHGELGVLAGCACVGEDLEGRLDHFEAGRTGDGAEGVAAAGAFELAVESDGLAGAEFVFEVGSVEPHALDRLEALTDGHLEDGRAPGLEENGSADFTDDAGHFTGLEFADGTGVKAVFVAERQVVKEVFDRLNAAFREVGGDTITDSLDELYRS